MEQNRPYKSRKGSAESTSLGCNFLIFDSIKIVLHHATCVHELSASGMEKNNEKKQNSIDFHTNVNISIQKITDVKISVSSND